MSFKKILLFISIFLIFPCIAEESDEAAVTIVSIGQAERETEKLLVSSPIIEGSLKGNEQQLIAEFMELLRNDFSFYRHRYDVEKQLVNEGFEANYKKWKDKGYEYVLAAKFTAKNEKLTVNLRVYSVSLEKIFYEINEVFPVANVRGFGHLHANSLFKKLNDKDSIFQKQILFVSDRTSRGKDTRKELYIMDFDGKGIRRLTHDNSVIISPAISPDNKTVLFTRIEGKWRRSSRGKPVKIQNLNLYTYDMTTHKSTLISDLDGLNTGAIFSTNPGKIYLTLSHQKNADIYEMDLKTKSKRRVTSHHADEVDPSINSSGSLMTFLSGRPGKAMIYTLDPSGTESNVKRIGFVGRFNAAPRFSPDGKEIVFSSWVDERFDLYKLNSDGSNLVRLTKNFGSNEEASFSPDGEFIIFTSQRVISRQLAVQNIYIMNKDGEIIRRLTDDYGKAFTPRWTN